MVCKIYGICYINDDIPNYDLVIFRWGYNFKNYYNYIISYYYNDLTVIMIFIIKLVDLIDL